MAADFLANLFPLMPEIYLLLAAFALLLYGAYVETKTTTSMIIAVLVALGLTLSLLPHAGAGRLVVMNGMFLSDGFTAFVKMLLIAGTGVVILVSSGWLRESKGGSGGRPFEYLLLVMLALVGMMLMVSSNNLLALYMGVEMAGLAQYVLASFERDDTRSTEAGIKYFILGALSSGMLLFGISLVYGFAGTIDFPQLALYLTGFVDEAAGNAQVPQAVVVGLVMILIAFCFKVSAVPFHMWTPDVYQGAPTPVTAFFSVAPKIAAFALFARLLTQPFADMFTQWQQIIVFVSLASMLVGALAALRQTNIKRLLAYSTIGHAGFMLMGLAAGTPNGVQGTLIYLALYIFMSAGAFGCVLLMKRKGEYVEEVADLAGLSRTQPWFAVILAAFMFSMAGIPPVAGFFAKLYVILPTVEAGLAWLAVAGLLTSVISCYYYLRIVKFMYFDEPAEEAFDTKIPFLMQVGLAICSIVVVFFFLMPAPLISQARTAATLLIY